MRPLFEVAVGIVLLAVGVGQASAQTCSGDWLDGPALSGTSAFGEVRCMTLWDPDGPGPLPNHVVIGGTFNAIGSVVASNIALWEPISGTWSTLGSGTNAAVRALAVLPDNTLVAGGSFTTSGGVTTSKIARWSGSSWTPLTGANGEGIGLPGNPLTGSVHALAVLGDGRLIVGGAFASAGGDLHRNLVAWKDGVWSELVAGGTGMTSNETVYALAVRPDGRLVIGGEFNFLGPVLANNLGQYTPGSVYQSLISGGTSARVEAIAVRNNGDIFIGGSFVAAGGSLGSVSRIARWNNAAQTWQAMGAGVPGPVYGLHAPSGTSDIYVAGAFFGVGISNVTRTNPSGSSYASMGGGVDDSLWPISGLPVNARCVLQVSPGLVLVGGSFTTAGGRQAQSIAKWNGGTWSTISVGISAPLTGLDVEPDGDVLATGYFTTAESATVNRFGRWNGSAWSGFGDGFEAPTFAVRSLHNGDIVVGGDFVQLNASFTNTINRIARWNGTEWAEVAQGLGTPLTGATPLMAIAQLVPGAATSGQGDLFIGGLLAQNMSSYSTIVSTNGATWSYPAGGLWIESGTFSNLTSAVFALLPLPSGDLVVGGRYDVLDGLQPVVSKHIGIWKPATQEYVPMGAGFNILPGVTVPGVYALARMPNGDIIAGGGFSNAGGPALNNIARWDGSQWLPLGTGTNDLVQALGVLPNGDLIAAGKFTAAGGVSASRIARWNGVSWSALGAGVNAPVRALVIRPDGEIVVAGDFTSAGGRVSAYFARFSDSPTPAFVTEPQSALVNCDTTMPQFTATVTPGYDVTYQWNFNGVPIDPLDPKFQIAPIPGGTRLSISLLYLSTLDEGDYSVTVTTPCGSITSAAATLTLFGDCPPPCPADFNGDTLVDDADFVEFALGYNLLDCNDPEMAEGCPADINDDGLVDDEDFVLFAEAYNELLCP